jgi:hypothetical protein
MWPFDQNNQQVYQQYAQAYDMGNYNGFDPYQAMGHIQQFMQYAPWDMQQNIYQQHFAQMPYEQRFAIAQQVPPQYGMNPNDPFSMAQGFARLGQERPDILAGIFRHPLLLGGSVVLAGLIAKHMIAHHERQQYEMYQQQQPQYGYNQSYGDPYGQGQRRHEEQQLRREIRREEQELRHLEERDRGW